ncbi:MAG TPA: hypothetical protein DCE78_10600 [Bacteroidetes bacterium]|nr:hypothetical protein [Bacteroidota bacterium]
MAKKLTKEQLENDALVTGYANTVNYIRHHTPTIIGITIGVLVIIAGAIGYSYYSANQENAAQAFLSHSEEAFLAADYETALKGDNSNLGVGLEAIIGSYSRTNAANMARYYAAISELEMGNPDIALTYIKDFDAPKGILGVNALAFHAVLLENSGDYKGAAAMYKRAANWDVNAGTTPANLLRAANAAVLAGDTKLASESVTTIIEKYESSTAFVEARKIQGRLAAN